MLTYPVLNNRPIDQWKVTELKDELRRRKLPIKGLKDELVKRLFEAVQDEILDGGEETVGGTPPDDDLKEDETPGSADASVYQASMEQNVDEGSSEVATQEGDPIVSITEASKEGLVATTDIIQEAVVATTEVSQKTPLAVAEVSEVPLVDVAATDEISLSDATATKGDDLESVPSDSAIVKGVYPRAEGHSEIIEEKAQEDGTIKKMTVDDVPSDVASTDVKLDATSAKGKFGGGVGCEILEQEAVPSPPESIMSHTYPWDGDAVATAPQQNAESLISKNKLGDDALMYGKDNEDCKSTNGDYKPTLCVPKDEVSEVNPDLGSQIKCVSISHDNISTNEKSNVKDNLNADNSDLEVEAKQEMVKPSSSIPSVGDDLQALDDEKELPKNETSLQEIDSITNMNLVKKEDSPDGSSPDKLNLDRSSGDESMEEDVMESKLVDSNIKSDYLRGKTEVTSEHVVEEVTLPDTVAEGSSVHTKEVVAEVKAVTPTEKRKPEAQEVVANNEPIKRQRRWNVDSAKIPEQQASKPSGSDTPKDLFKPALKRSFGRSDSTASGGFSPKERIVPPPQKPATTSLRIDRFVRPFTLKAVQELLGKTGSICSFWMDHIKTHCYVTYSSVEEAVATRNAVYNLQWPPNNGNYLVAEFVDPQEVKLKLEPPPPWPAPIIPSTATTPKAAPFQQSKANQTMPPHAADTSRGLFPTPQPLTKPPPTSDPGPAREKLPPTPKNAEPTVVTFDDLFKKTQAYPRIYYMPLSEEEVSARLAAHGKGKTGG